MRKKSVGIIIFIQLAMTILLVYDFFPQLNIPVGIPEIMVLGILLLLVSVGILSSRLNSKDVRGTWVWQLASTGYLFLLIGILTMLGGVSQTEISFQNPILWVVLAISVHEIHQQKKKLKSATALD
ncbi:hypothetical protein [Planococcus sp. ISL-110]|uniref:hypothetical protein n=1 Tax=Planococcus sp. ISL-110 TaxID=2819167 RepID=UPI001BEA7FD5|nr:hypothetical protein [Planococcus sp. ISL-110]MBT2570798.1 hypothetical protein [Planococcus sp. ISL-110]